MRASVLLNTLCVAGALATPVEKRAVVTDLTVITITEYVTLPAPAYTPTSTPEQQPSSSPAPAPQAPSSSAPVEAKVPVANDDEVKVVKVTETAEPVKPTQAPAPDPQPEPSSSAPAQQPTQQAPGPGASIQDQVLYYHNNHRANHTGTEPLTWNAGLASAAQKTANSCLYQHNMDVDKATVGGYGQNIGWGCESWGNFITNQMYNGEMNNYVLMNLFGVEPPRNQLDKYGHFTQMVWKGSKTVGCAVSDGSSSCAGKFMVCNYGPQGNVIGSYAINVAQPIGQAMAVA